MTYNKRMEKAAVEYSKKNRDAIHSRRIAIASDNATYKYGLRRSGNNKIARIDRDGNAKEFSIELNDGKLADVSVIWAAVIEGLISDDQFEQIFKGETVETVMGVGWD